MPPSPSPVPGPPDASPVPGPPDASPSPVPGPPDASPVPGPPDASPSPERKSRQRRLTEDDRRDIRRLRALGFSNAEIAERVGVTRDTVSRWRTYRDEAWVPQHRERVAVLLATPFGAMTTVLLARVVHATGRSVEDLAAHYGVTPAEFRSRLGTWRWRWHDA